MWGYFNASGVGRICLVEGIMDSAKYANILENNLLDSVLDIGLGRRYVFQQAQHAEQDLSKMLVGFWTDRLMN